MQKSAWPNSCTTTRSYSSSGVSSSSQPKFIVGSALSIASAVVPMYDQEPSCANEIRISASASVPNSTVMLAKSAQRLAWSSTRCWTDGVPSRKRARRRLPFCHFLPVTPASSSRVGGATPIPGWTTTIGTLAGFSLTERSAASISFSGGGVLSMQACGCMNVSSRRWYTDRMTSQVPVRLTEGDLAALDRAVASGRFSSRSDALRAGLKAVLCEERDREIEEAYRRGYGKYPQEEWVGEV